MTYLQAAVSLFILSQIFEEVTSQFMPPMPMPYPPGSMPMGMPMPPMPGAAPPGMPHPNLPVVVMPYHSKTAHKSRYKSRRRRYHKAKVRRIKYRDLSSDSDDTSDSSSSSDNKYRRFGGAKTKIQGKRIRQVLTPVVSYVTKNGYVVFQKKIQSEKAKDWLEFGRRNRDVKDEIPDY